MACRRVALLLILLPTSMAMTAVSRGQASGQMHGNAGAAMMRRELEDAGIRTGLRIHAFEASASADRSDASIWEVAMALFDGFRERLHNFFEHKDAQDHHQDDDASWLGKQPPSLQVFSQNDEDGILKYLFENLKSTNKYYVEFGAEDGTEDNTRLLRERYGWHGLTMDGSHQNYSRGLYKELIYPSNIVGLFQKYRVPMEPALLSVDVDSFDAFVLKKILDANYRPQVLVVEANDNYGVDSYLSFPGDVKVSLFGYSPWGCGQTCTFADPRDGLKTKTSMCGAGVRAVDHIAGQAGYRSVYLNKVNLFLVRTDLLPAKARETWTFDKVLQQAHTFGRRQLQFPRPECFKEMSGLVDVRQHPAQAEG
mmetsp:Transcript_121260/g.213794  ORF Transcript_121260/g.213794 Transcript_121260/m.213794 type:complete len:367 (+) Transcript_121260:86-1186(+)